MRLSRAIIIYPTDGSLDLLIMFFHWCSSMKQHTEKLKKLMLKFYIIQMAMDGIYGDQ